ncbi:hypothetical protein IFR05_000682 [Cadophora sp. M221]|nr:hypothetical protein IFR05_000682 [Cadophora sp. M221]
MINVALLADGLGATLRALSRQDELKEEIRSMRTEIKTKWAMEIHIALGRERRKVLALFGRVDPAFNHQASLKLRHPLTGLWLWLSGIPAAGKTILAASLIEDAANESSSTRALTYFYCDYKDTEKQVPLNVIGSLTVHLARQNEDAFLLLHEFYKTLCVDGQLTHQPQLLALETTLQSMTRCFEDVSIIVDGLDECGDDISSVADSVTSLTTSDQSNKRLLILGRDLYEIRCILVTSRNFSPLDIAARSEDLELYVAT